MPMKNERFQPFFDFIKDKKLYLALSGGGLALVCHIAVIRFIETFGIDVERVYGTSAGALVGGMFAAGMSSEQMQESVLRLKDPDDLFGRGSRHFLYRVVKSEFFNREFRSAGIYDGKRLESYIEEELVRSLGRVPSLGELQLPFSAVAFNLGSGRNTNAGRSVKQVFSKERTPELSLKDAVVASISIPGIFPPKKIGRYYYIDGGVVEHLPIVTAYEDWLGSKRFFKRNVAILAVNLGYGGVKLRESSNVRPHDMVLYATSIQGKTIDQYSLLRVHRPKKGSSVVLLKPRCYDIGLTDFQKIPGAIEISYKQIKEQLAGRNFLKETVEDIEKGKRTLGLSDS
jgi:NTE family protein